MRAEAHKVRGKAEKFADHYTQATLFWNSQTAVEKTHIVNAFRFELSKVQVVAIRERMVAGLMNVAPELGEAVATGLGMKRMPEPLPKVLPDDITPEVTQSPALSLFARGGDGGVRGRRVALMVADDVDGDDLRGLASELLAAGVVTRFVGSRLGTVNAGSGEPIEVDATFENSPAVLFDAVVVPGGSEATTRLAADGKAVEFVRDQYRHCKPMLILGDASTLLTLAGITGKLASGKADPGLVVGRAGKAAAQAAAFLAALAKHRHFERETEPPVV
jgi:catalase